MKTMIVSVFAAALVLGTGTARAQDWGDDDEAESDDYLFDDDESESESEPEAEVETKVATGGAAVAPGQLGFGVGQILLGTVGAEVEYYLDENVLITGHLGIETFSPDIDMADSATLIALAAAGFYRLAGDDTTTLYAGGRLALGFASNGATINDGSAIQFGIELPARVQLRLNRSVALHLEGGFLLTFVPEEGSAIGPNLPDATVLALGGQLFGGAGVTVYLD